MVSRMMMLTKILDVASKSMKLEDSNEVKVSVISFKSTKLGVSPSGIVSARPQSNNETSKHFKVCG